MYWGTSELKTPTQIKAGISARLNSQRRRHAHSLHTTMKQVGLIQPNQSYGMQNQQRYYSWGGERYPMQSHFGMYWNLVGQHTGRKRHVYTITHNSRVCLEWLLSHFQLFVFDVPKTPSESYYDTLGLLGIPRWNPSNPDTLGRGVCLLVRCSDFRGCRLIGCLG